VKPFATARLTFCDITTFYCERGGGVRTYHRAKIDWFARQRDHRYVLVYPGQRFRERAVSPTVTLVEVYGPTTGRGADGYRVLLDYRRVRRVLSTLEPDVIEAGDPWISGPFALAARRAGRLRGLLASFYHTDSLEAYLEPWLRRRAMPGVLRSAMSEAARRLFWKVQAKYDCTLVSSPSMQRRLQAEGIHNVAQTPFGVEPRLLDGPPRKATAGRPVRLLYAGRLQDEKSFDLLLAGLPRLVDRPGVRVTIAGDGPYAAAVARLNHPQVSFVGYVENRVSLLELYRAHDILLSPSATETFGIATLEAMATGLVVVGADTGGVGDLMSQARSPFVFEARNGESLVRAARAAIEADRSEASARARAVAEGYGTWADAIARQTSVYRELLARRQASRPAALPLARPAQHVP